MERCKQENVYEEVSMHVLTEEFPNYTKLQWLTIFNLVVYFIILITFLIDCKSAFFNTRFLLPLIIVIVSTGVLVIFCHGESRFHQPMMPFIIMASGHFIAGKFRVFENME